MIFPCFYPFTRCEVIARDLDLRWHRNLYIGNLCLLGRSTNNWDTTMTLARLLEEQLPKLLEVARSEDQAAAQDREEIQAEPLSAYLPYMANSIVFVLDDSPISWRLAYPLTGREQHQPTGPQDPLEYCVRARGTRPEAVDGDFVDTARLFARDLALGR